MNCPNCNSINRGDARFCRHCGIDLTVVVESSEATQPLTSPDESVQSESMTSEAKSSGLEKTSDEDTLITDTPSELVKHENSTLETQISNPESVSASDSQVDQPVKATELPNSTSQIKQGDIIAERYQILDINKSEKAEPVVFSAIDLLACPSCGSVNMLNDDYCIDCGSQLGISYEAITLCPADETSNDVEQIEINGINYVVIRSKRDAPMDVSAQQLRFVVGMQSDVGKLREVDQDSLLVLQLSSLTELSNLPLLGVFAVADGMGGHEFGEIASNLAIRTYAKHLVEKVFMPSFEGVKLDQQQLIQEVNQAVMAANQAILEFASQSENDHNVGSTITTVLIYDNTAIVANVGDSRTYLLRNGKLIKQTQDHSLVARLVEQGVYTEQEAAVSGEKHVILRSLGDKHDLEVDIFSFELQVGDRFLLCCDGLWEPVDATIIEDILLTYVNEPQRACDELVNAANLAGGADNISAIAIDLIPQSQLAFPEE